ncbi:hypothetical protein ACFQ0B_45470 [Nonomuraea thailandensis]
MVTEALIPWLRDSDPALRWQVERDLLHEPPEVWEATRARVATEGFGARLLALQDPDGQWAGGAFFPAGFDFATVDGAQDNTQPWTATTWTLNSLREWGLDAAALRGTAELLDKNCRWEYEDLPYWDGEVDCCINAWTVENGLWLGAPVTGIVDWFVEHRLPDGGWNCEWIEGSTRSSFHSTLNSLKGLLAYDVATGGTDATRPPGAAARSTCCGAGSCAACPRASRWRRGWAASPTRSAGSTACSTRPTTSAGPRCSTACRPTRAWPRRSSSSGPPGSRTAPGCRAARCRGRCGSRSTCRRESRRSG